MSFIVDQIYSITSDNGRNMLKTTSLLNDDLDIEIENEVRISENDIQIDTVVENSENDFMIENAEEIYNLISNEKKSEYLINTVRCAAHTIQLAVSDILKISMYKKKINKFRDVSVCLRTPSHRNSLNYNNFRLPLLNNLTRWNSTYLMIERLVELNEYCKQNENIYKDLKIDDETWDFAEEYLKIFSPVKTATLKLQTEQLPLGDFYKIWLELKLTLQTMTEPLAVSILNSIEQRETQLLDNKTLLAALYLDPRFHCTMPINKRDSVITHLKYIFNHMQHLLPSSNESLPSSSINASTSTSTCTYVSDSEPTPSTSNEITSIMDNYLLGLIGDNMATNYNQNRLNAYKEIENYKPPLMTVTTNILDYWLVKEHEFPVLSQLAKIVHATPATEVSVERCFSSLKLLLTEQRNRLQSDTIENILLVKYNGEMKYSNNY